MPLNPISGPKWAYLLIRLHAFETETQLEKISSVVSKTLQQKSGFEKMTPFSSTMLGIVAQRLMEAISHTCSSPTTVAGVSREECLSKEYQADKLGVA